MCFRKHELWREGQNADSVPDFDILWRTRSQSKAICTTTIKVVQRRHDIDIGIGRDFEVTEIIWR